MAALSRTSTAFLASAWGVRTWSKVNRNPRVVDILLRQIERLILSWYFRLGLPRGDYEWLWLRLLKCVWYLETVKPALAYKGYRITGLVAFAWHIIIMIQLGNLDFWLTLRRARLIDALAEVLNLYSIPTTSVGASSIAWVRPHNLAALSKISAWNCISCIRKATSSSRSNEADCLVSLSRGGVIRSWTLTGSVGACWGLVGLGSWHRWANFCCEVSCQPCTSREDACSPVSWSPSRS